ncbi:MULTISPECIES: hypothetical protein [unclassified Flavobacterium]|uniref:hypothetical protein n=1 Tax=unclassified Flavobacterium TaxID=196869 RepID=UPI000F0D1421|nr:MULTISPECIES: hypothetical protein [unclassified Flavobacterium]AYN05568.1 hypothetical protein EAG11_16485 [Flavobacterium sp. 140616W15]MCD0474426.1 hypothetical protein [Flavobacterium sp. EDS]
MGHDTSALIGRMPINIDKIKFYGLAVAFEDDFAIIFLDEDHLFRWSLKLNLDYYSGNENLRFGDELIHFLAKEIELEEYIITYLSFEFYGELYKNALKIDEGEINLILRKIGVDAYNSANEFHKLNLDNYRMSECYYWEGESNWANLRKNIIAGHIDN